MTLIWLAAASCYGLLYCAFCLKRRRILSGIAMGSLALYPLGLGLIWLFQTLS